jgi:hypothetical protein
MTVLGEPYAWEPATIEVVPRAGGAPRSWEIDRGLMEVPAWSADGTRILAVESPRGGEPTLLALNVTDGSRQTITHDTIATGAADGTIVARDARLLRIAGRKTTVLAEHEGGRIWRPIASPNGAVAYVVGWPTQSMDLRLLAVGTDSLALVAGRHPPVRGARRRLGLAAVGDPGRWLATARDGPRSRNHRRPGGRR